MQAFHGVWIPLVTPFDHGRVDVSALTRLVQHLDVPGLGGFVVCGTTGEATSLSTAERDAVLEAVLDTTRKPVLLGLSGSSAAEVVAKMRRVEQRPVAGFLVSPPAYVRPSQEGVIRFFETIADAAHQPLVVYDVPARTGVEIELDSLRALAEHARVVAVKDCAGDRRKTEALIFDGDLAVLCGTDEEWFASRALGGAGAIAASAHVRPDLFVAFDRALAMGELSRAQGLWRLLAPLTRALFEEPNPGPLKAVLAAQGWLRNDLREPMLPASEAVLKRIAPLVAALDGHVG